MQKLQSARTLGLDQCERLRFRASFFQWFNGNTGQFDALMGNRRTSVTNSCQRAIDFSRKLLLLPLGLNFTGYLTSGFRSSCLVLNPFDQAVHSPSCCLVNFSQHTRQAACESACVEVRGFVDALLSSRIIPGCSP